MIGVEANIQLPFVADGDPLVVEQMAERLAAVVDCRLPGFGIAHTSEDGGNGHESVHLWHQELVLAAAGVLKPEIIADETFGRFGFYNQQRDFNQTVLHCDDPHRKNIFMLDDHPTMLVRLHTADPQRGARVILANTTPEYFAPLGDAQCSGGQAKSWGYEVDRLWSPPTGLVPLATNGITAQRFGFDEEPLSSVIFRTNSYFGPVVAHQFASPSGNARKAYLSDLVITSQTT